MSERINKQRLDTSIFSDSAKKSSYCDILRIASIEPLKEKDVENAFLADEVVNEQLADLLDMTAAAALHIDSENDENRALCNTLELIAGVVRAKGDAMALIHERATKLFK